MEGLRGYNLDDTLFFGEPEGRDQKNSNKVRSSSLEMEQKSGKRRRTFVKVAARDRASSGMVTARQLGMFNRPTAPMRAARGINSTSVFQPPRGSELKTMDVNTAISPAAGSTAGTLSALLNPCAQGIDYNQHIGRETRMKSLYWAFYAQLQATTAGSSALRVVIVYDKESEGAAPTIATGAQTDIFNQDNILAKMNLNNRDRFIVLVDEIVECIGTGGPQACFRKGYRKVSLPVVFNGAGATVASINTGAVYAVCWQDGYLITAGPIVTLDTRIRFDDA